MGKDERVGLHFLHLSGEVMDGCSWRWKSIRESQRERYLENSKREGRRCIQRGLSLKVADIIKDDSLGEKFVRTEDENKGDLILLGGEVT